MGGFPIVGRRPVQCRVLVLYRIDPAVARQLLPAGMEPRLHGGRAVAATGYTRIRGLAGWWLRQPGPTFDHLTYRFPVRNGGSTGTWVPRRETSALLAGRLGRAFVRGDYVKARFSLDEDSFGLELSIEDADGEELFLRAAVGDPPDDALFTTPGEVVEFLRASRVVRPYDVFAPEADRFAEAESSCPEPLVVEELRSRYFQDHSLFPPGSVLVDSAWRWVTRSRRRIRTGARLRPKLSTESSPALPTIG